MLLLLLLASVAVAFAAFAAADAHAAAADAAAADAAAADAAAATALLLVLLGVFFVLPTWRSFAVRLYEKECTSMRRCAAAVVSAGAPTK